MSQHKSTGYKLLQKRQRRRSQQAITSHKLRVIKKHKATGLDDCGASCGRCDVCLAGT